MAEYDKSKEDLIDLFDTEDGDPLALVDQDTADAGVDTPAEPTPTVPDKFKGKTLDEAIAMYTNLETAYGRQGNELGEMKNLADQILKNQVAVSTPKEALDADTLLEDPAKVINDLVAQHPAIQEISGRVGATEQTITVEALERKYGRPLTAIAAEEEFQNWVKSSPARVRRFAKADGGDLLEADDLLTTYQELKEARGHSDKDSTTQDKQRRALATPSAGSGSSPSRLNEAGSKKLVFSKQQLMQLKFNNPERYAKMQPQIMAAYRDDRVR